MLRSRLALTFIVVRRALAPWKMLLLLMFLQNSEFSCFPLRKIVNLVVQFVKVLKILAEVVHLSAVVFHLCLLQLLIQVLQEEMEGRDVVLSILLIVLDPGFGARLGRDHTVELLQSLIHFILIEYILGCYVLDDSLPLLILGQLLGLLALF